MVFHIDLHQPLTQSITPVAHKQLERIAAGLTATDDDPIFTARKSLKKLRALLRLHSAPSESRPARKLDRQLRIAARVLAPQRDAHVLALTWSFVCSEMDLNPKLRAEGARALATMVHPTALELDAEAWLMAARADLARQFRTDVTVLDLARAAGQTYRRARRHSKRAHADPTTETCHDWRKCVLTHRRHMQLLADLWPEDLAVRVTATKQLGDLLGLDHDLALLATWLSSRACPRALNPKRRDIARWIKARRAKLRIEALTLGQRLFAERSTAFTARLKIYARLLPTQS